MDLLHFTVAEQCLHSWWCTYYSCNLSVPDILLRSSARIERLQPPRGGTSLPTSQRPSRPYIPGIIGLDWASPRRRHSATRPPARPPLPPDSKGRVREGSPVPPTI
ncbi:hypothetical protein J6590_048437 [Homalodisca vitripennis]|nr:hypothetical protein J6590_048437 [Homalodisca vitripennis]